MLDWHVDYIITPGIHPDGTPAYFLFRQDVYDGKLGAAQPAWIASSESQMKLVMAIEHLWGSPKRMKFGENYGT